MTYNEWRDELKQNLLCVTPPERQRVLDYYAEAYADRREAGFSEREIIEDFGAPYDAAQRILSENKAEFREFPDGEDKTRRERRRENRERRRDGGAYAPPPPPDADYRADAYPPPPPNAGYRANAYPPPPPMQNPPATDDGRGDYSWAFVLLCIIFAIPLFGLIMTMVGITIALCCVPFGVIAAGAAGIGGGVGIIIGGNTAYGVTTLAGGLIALGIGIMLCPICFNLVKLMWKLFKTVFTRLKYLFSGKRRHA